MFSRSVGAKGPWTLVTMPSATSRSLVKPMPQRMALSPILERTAQLPQRPQSSSASASKLGNTTEYQRHAKTGKTPSLGKPPLLFAQRETGAAQALTLRLAA